MTTSVRDLENYPDFDEEDLTLIESEEDEWGWTPEEDGDSGEPTVPELAKEALNSF